MNDSGVISLIQNHVDLKGTLIVKVIKEIYDHMKENHNEFYVSCPNRRDIESTLRLFLDYLKR